MSIDSDHDVGNVSVAVNGPTPPPTTKESHLRLHAYLDRARTFTSHDTLVEVWRHARRRWPDLRLWLEAHSSNPDWLPHACQHPLAGYVGAVTLQICAALATLGLLHVLPIFVLPALPVALAVMLAAASWGAGPALCAVLVGTALINLPALAPHFPSRLAAANSLIELCLLLAAGLGVGLAVGQSRRARRNAEVLSAMLDAERARLEDAIDAIPELVAKRMDEFLGIASHEIRTPLTAIQANAQFLARRLQNPQPGARIDDPAQVAEAARVVVDRIQRQVVRLNRLVGDLICTSHIQTSRLDLRLSPCDLGAIVDEAVHEQRQMMPGRSVRLDIPDGLCAPVRADADRIAQVVANYVNNALKFSAEDRPVVVRMRCKRGQARVSVRDEGPGLPPDEQERIWDRFHQVDGIEVRSGSGVGLGLGLYISRALIERHGGEVGVESVPGAGSTFWFCLPLARDA
jgi:signal transduction histidine kinase